MHSTVTVLFISHGWVCSNEATNGLGVPSCGRCHVTDFEPQLCLLANLLPPITAPSLLPAPRETPPPPPTPLTLPAPPVMPVASTVPNTTRFSTTSRPSAHRISSPTNPSIRFNPLLLSNARVRLIKSTEKAKKTRTKTADSSTDPFINQSADASG